MDKESLLLEAWSLIKRRYILLISLTILGLSGAALFTFYVATPQYTSTTQLLVRQSRGERNVLELSHINTNLLLIDTYRELITGPAILNEVSRDLNGTLSSQQLSNMITVSSPQNAQVFDITVTHSDPEFAAEIANRVAMTFQIEIGEIMDNVNHAVITYSAEPAMYPVSPNHLLNLIIGAVLGFVSGITFVMVQNIADITLKDHDYITDEIGWNNLGSINTISSSKR